jgi:hypothetical protein
MPTTMTQTQVNVTTDAIDPREIRAIELPDGWHDVTSCELVQFALGEAHSPIYPTKLYPALRYTNEFGKLVRTPLSQVLSFSEEPVKQNFR